MHVVWRNLDHRPRGITILSVLLILSGILALIVGIFLALFSIALINMMMLMPFLSIFLLIGIIYIGIGIGYFFVANGLLKGKGWAWKLAVIFQFVAIASTIVSLILSIIFNTPMVYYNSSGSMIANSSPNGSILESIIITIIILGLNIAILFYLFSRKVKGYFGKK